MLRNATEVDRLGSMNYWATGTIASAGQTVQGRDYKASVNWIPEGDARRLSAKGRRNAMSRS